MANKNSNSTGAFINAAMYILMGILMCIFRADLLNWAMTAIGIIFVVSGIIRALKNEIVEGVIIAAIGVVIILGGWLFIDIILLILGAVLTVKGILDLFKAIEIKYIPAIIGPIITMIVGVLLIVSKWALLDWFFIIIGVVLIIDGIMIVLTQLKKN